MTQRLTQFKIEGTLARKIFSFIANMHRLSARRNRSLPSSRPPTTLSERANSPTFTNRNVWSKVDRVSQRLSYWAQIFGVLLALAGLWYTVIPLYQKALLDEVIAQKELELKHTNEALEQTYRKSYEYTVQRFKWSAIPNCSGLFDYDAKSQKNEYPSLDIDVKKCLEKIRSEQAEFFDVLRKPDREKLDEEISIIGESLNSSREKTIQEIKHIPNTINSQNEDQFIAKSKYSKSMLDNLSQWNDRLEKIGIKDALDIKSKKHEVAVSSAISERVRQYELELQLKIKNMAQNNFK